MDEGGQTPQQNKNRKAKAPLVVGVGASASAMNSIERFLSRLSLDPDVAVVLVLPGKLLKRAG
jgi:two-component system, chemotaxis family, CheB/CheR fusion protein